MTAVLPAVPEEAVEAAAGALGWLGVRGRDWLAGALQAALPHLYAAALRHAADRIKAAYSVDEWFRTATARDACDELRRMADEAVQG